ncbi:MAG: hypothetical protein ACLGHQ_03690, partial [Acidimicrobiia bacterium]
MEHGPLPPHERTWRHPSELAAEEHAVARAETTGVTTRAFAFTSGSLGLLAVGLLMLAVSPDRSSAPVAISATTTPVERPTSVVPTASASNGSGPVALRGRPDVLATPLGDGRFAVVTAADLAEDGDAAHIGATVDVGVPSGRTVGAVVVAHGGDAVLVELDRPEPGHAVARVQPAGHEVVTVLAEPPVTIVLDDLPRLQVEEGTAVLDDTGELVGLCSQDDDATRLVLVSDMAMDDVSSPDDGAVPQDDTVPGRGAPEDVDAD